MSEYIPNPWHVGVNTFGFVSGLVLAICNGVDGDVLGAALWVVSASLFAFSLACQFIALLLGIKTSLQVTR